MERLQEHTNKSRQDIEDIFNQIEKIEKDIKWLNERIQIYRCSQSKSLIKDGRRLGNTVNNIKTFLDCIKSLYSYPTVSEGIYDIQTSRISEQLPQYKDDGRDYQYLLFKTLNYVRRLSKTLEERDKVFSLRDVFLPIQLILGNLHGGLDASVEKEQLAVQLKNIIASPIPESESEPEQNICKELDTLWDNPEDAKAEAETEWIKLKRIMQPPIYSRQLIEKLTVLLSGSECSEDAIKAALESCGIMVRYYEEADEEMKCYFARREHGLPYPGLFVLGYDGKLRSQRSGTYIDKEDCVR